MKSEAVTAFGQILGILAMGLLLVFGFVLGFVSVTDAIVSRHSISTKDALGFSEEKFSRITTGMTPAQVRGTLGEPLSISGTKDKGQEWWYTAPKEPIEGWGTWDGRYLIVSNGMVT